MREATRAVIVLPAFALEPLRRLTGAPRGAGWQRWIAPALVLEHESDDAPATLAMDATVAFATRDDRDGAFSALTAATPR